LADEGTLFLDEIGELPLEMQVKLLRVLEEREFMRVGGTQTIKVDIRLIAATNRDLEVLVEEKRFRSDLYYRLKVVTIRIPPLRERGGDIPLLANHFLGRLGQENNRPNMRFSAASMRALMATRWEGNVRELRNLVESLVVLAPEDEIQLDDIPAEYRTAAEPGALPAVVEAGATRPSLDDDNLTMDEIERRAIVRALERTSGNRTQAAEMLGIGLRTLQRKLKEYRLAGKSD
jgi:two-component system NtrC family response regulator/two-component system response regulator HydG